MRILVVGLVLFCLTGNASGQSDTTEMLKKVLSAVNVRSIPVRQLSFAVPQLSTDVLRVINAADAGELMRYLPGIVLRSYGGLGGLKTVSSRGMSSQDNSIVVDGFERNGAQTGQVNLAQIETEQLMSVEKYDPEYSILYIPVSTTVKGNAILFNTLISQYESDTIHISATAKYGSYNTREVNASGMMAGKSQAFSFFGKYRSSDGDYPYSFQNGLLKEKSVRFNNDYQDGYINLGYRYRMETSQLQVRYRYMNYDQGVPGAVILYNNSANERLEGDDHRVELDYRKFSKYRIYAMLSANSLTYTDPNYYGDTSGLTANYMNNEAVLGYTQRLIWKNPHALFIGVETKLNNLQSDRYFVADPLRSSNVALLSYTYQARYWHVRLNLSEQYYYDRIGDSTAQRWGFTPTLSFQRMESEKGITWTAYYKRSLRMPTFNELYYGGIGNTELKPEEADQLSTSMIWRSKQDGKWNIYFRPSIYTNLVKNKINAIPTKNLFVWSMQNVGKVWMYGADVDVTIEKPLKKEGNHMGLKVVYNWIKCLDITDRTSPTYLNQIAYIPEHSVSGDVYLTIRNWKFRIMNTILSHRYALNENIDANLVEGFWITDLSIGRRIKLSRNSQLTIQANANNIFNASYAFVRNYIMPGRNFQITLRYAYK